MISGRVVNASPLILLSKVGLLGVLRDASVPVRVPMAVRDEVEKLGPADPVVRAMAECDWIEIVPSPEIPVEITSWQLGMGESAVLALARTAPGTLAILDDLAARRCARSLGIPLQGTAGLIIVAKQIGLISEVRPVLDHLHAIGMYISERLRRDILNGAGEIA